MPQPAGRKVGAACSEHRQITAQRPSHGPQDRGHLERCKPWSHRCFRSPGRERRCTPPTPRAMQRSTAEVDPSPPNKSFSAPTMLSRPADTSAWGAQPRATAIATAHRAALHHRFSGQSWLRISPGAGSAHAPSPPRSRVSAAPPSAPGKANPRAKRHGRCPNPSVGFGERLREKGFRDARAATSPRDLRPKACKCRPRSAALLDLPRCPMH